MTDSVGRRNLPRKVYDVFSRAVSTARWRALPDGVGGLPYLVHSYNCTWRNERAIEVPLAQQFVAGRSGRGLEVGNVLSHYGGPFGHDVVDKYEHGQGIINADILDFRPSRPYDWVVSVSTLEHVGRDEGEDDSKAADALMHLRRLLASDGRLFVTVALGHNPALDEHLRRRQEEPLAGSTYIRTRAGRWERLNSVEPRPYNYRRHRARSIWVGEYGRAAAP